jgi:hypothetical protein
MFGFVLLWSSSARHHQSCRTWGQMGKINTDGRWTTADKKMDHKLHFSSSKSASDSQVKLLPEEQYTIATGKNNNDFFLFTRSLKTFDSPDNFYIYAVNTTSGESPLEWSEVLLKQLLHNFDWKPSTTFDELVHLGSVLQPTESTTTTQNSLHYTT